MATQIKFIEMIKDYSKEDLVILKEVINLLLKTYPKEKELEKESQTFNNVEEFIEKVVNKEYNIDKKKWINKNKITIDDLYKEYCSWCNENAKYCFAKNVFSRVIPKYEIKERGKSKIGKTMKRWIVFN